MSEKLEPSMEQILASIRKIMAEEEANPQDENVLELTNWVQDDGTVTNLKSVKENSDHLEERDEPLQRRDLIEENRNEANIRVEEKEAAASKMPTSSSPEALKAPLSKTSDENEESLTGLLSESALNASVAALSTLTAAARQSTEAHKSNVGQQTLEQLMASLLKPLLQEWLNQNLPDLVQRVVEQEVKNLIMKIKD